MPFIALPEALFGPRNKVKMNKYTYLIVIIAVAIFGYFYLSKPDNKPAQEATISEELIDPKEILKYDPNAPAWMQEAESCKIVAGKVFCKMPGE